MRAIIRSPQDNIDDVLEHKAFRWLCRIFLGAWKRSSQAPGEVELFHEQSDKPTALIFEYTHKELRDRPDTIDGAKTLVPCQTTRNCMKAAAEALVVEPEDLKLIIRGEAELR